MSLEIGEREEAKERQGTRIDIVQNLPDVEFGKSRDKVGERYGVTCGKFPEVVNTGQSRDKVAKGKFCKWVKCDFRKRVKSKGKRCKTRGFFYSL
jgi:hypothetical protein